MLPTYSPPSPDYLPNRHFYDEMAYFFGNGEGGEGVITLLFLYSFNPSFANKDEAVSK